jgi:hypothetical protein
MPEMRSRRDQRHCIGPAQIGSGRLACRGTHGTDLKADIRHTEPGLRRAAVCRMRAATVHLISPTVRRSLSRSGRWLRRRAGRNPSPCSRQMPRTQIIRQVAEPQAAMASSVAVSSRSGSGEWRLFLRLGRKPDNLWAQFGIVQTMERQADSVFRVDWIEPHGQCTTLP